MTPQFRKQLESCETITSKRDWFENLDDAVQHTDSLIRDRLLELQKKWTTVHPMFQLAYKLATERDRHDPFAHVLPMDNQRFGCPWQYCGRLDVKAYESILWKPGMKGRELLLIQS